jgi:hypothetical protein
VILVLRLPPSPSFGRWKPRRLKVDPESLMVNMFLTHDIEVLFASMSKGLYEYGPKTRGSTMATLYCGKQTEGERFELEFADTSLGHKHITHSHTH